MQKFMIVVNSMIRVEIIYYSIQNSDKFMLCDNLISLLANSDSTILR